MLLVAVVTFVAVAIWDRTERLRSWLARRPTPAPWGEGGTLEVARRADRLRHEWDRLRRGRGPTIDKLADAGNSLGWTAGDAAVVGVETLRVFDRLSDAERVCEAIAAQVSHGTLSTVSGIPLNQVIHPDGARYLAAYVIGNVYPSTRKVLDDYIDGIASTESHGTSSRKDADRVSALQSEYAHLNANLAPTLAEATRLAAIRRELAELGSVPDEQVNRRVKRELGIPDTPYNT